MAAWEPPLDPDELARQWTEYWEACGRRLEAVRRYAAWLVNHKGSACRVPGTHAPDCECATL